MTGIASDLAARLAGRAEAVCRHYLSSGNRKGRYWIVGDVRGTPGRSMFVRLKGTEHGKGAAGKWTDAATGEHGDLLDVIREACGISTFRETAEEARRFLNLPHLAESEPPWTRTSAPTGSPEAARRLFAMAQPINGTLAETYLRRRAITALHNTASLRFHPRCFYRAGGNLPTETWPAMVAAVTDPDGRVVGAHRTYLDPDGFSERTFGKAPVDQPRRAMGSLLGAAVRFGRPGSVLAAGEGIETVLSLRCVLPAMPMAAALSAANLAALTFPTTLRRLYIARDDDAAGDAATSSLLARAESAGIEAIFLSPALGDFNDDLRLIGINALRAAVRVQIAPQDVEHFMLHEGRSA